MYPHLPEIAELLQTNLRILVGTEKIFARAESTPDPEKPYRIVVGVISKAADDAPDNTAARHEVFEMFPPSEPNRLWAVCRLAVTDLPVYAPFEMLMDTTPNRFFPYMAEFFFRTRLAAAEEVFDFELNELLNNGSTDSGLDRALK